MAKKATTAVIIIAIISILSSSVLGKTLVGLDVLLSDPSILKDKRVGVITNPTGINQEGKSVIDLFYQNKEINITAIFAPEHGFRGDKAAGESLGDQIDTKTGLPVFSLYGKTLKPTYEMLEQVDVLIFDIQDIGARFYTYIYTMANAMEACAEWNKEFIVLDRPNPLGGHKVDGPVLELPYSSFVGKYPITITHGMTVGELARLFNEQFLINCDLTVIPMKNWHRGQWFDETGLKWVNPSPNIRSLRAATVYPGLCFLEGTNISEGRGTETPFEIFGAPFIDKGKLTAELNRLNLPGCYFEPVEFIPTTSKWEGKRCEGSKIIVTDREKFLPEQTGLYIIQKIHDLYPKQFEWISSHFDRLLGSSKPRETIVKSKSLNELFFSWQERQSWFLDLRDNYLLY
jgi:uncharacterized protein YbbC (DUF1343 family)